LQIRKGHEGFPLDYIFIPKYYAWFLSKCGLTLTGCQVSTKLLSDSPISAGQVEKTRLKTRDRDKDILREGSRGCARKQSKQKDLFPTSHQQAMSNHFL